MTTQTGRDQSPEPVSDDLERWRKLSVDAAAIHPNETADTNVSHRIVRLIDELVTAREEKAYVFNLVQGIEARAERAEAALERVAEDRDAIATALKGLGGFVQTARIVTDSADGIYAAIEALDARDAALADSPAAPESQR